MKINIKNEFAFIGDPQKELSPDEQIEMYESKQRILQRIQQSFDQNLPLILMADPFTLISGKHEHTQAYLEALLQVLPLQMVLETTSKVIVRRMKSKIANGDLGDLCSDCPNHDDCQDD